MTTTLPETGVEIGLDILESLDFDPELPCEHFAHAKGVWGHTGPGELIVLQTVPCGCLGHKQVVLCRSSWEYAFKTGIKCVRCNRSGPRDEWWTLIGTVK